jgi:hypothetical protein
MVIQARTTGTISAMEIGITRPMMLTNRASKSFAM